MFIIRLLFYLADGTMDSSFLIGLHISLGLFACVLFLKMMIQFGLPNHPARLVSYLVGFCVCAYFIGLSATDLGLVSPWHWMKWRALPLIAGSLFLLLETVILIGSFSLIQQKVISRLPFMAALLAFAFFSQMADTFAIVFLLLGGLFLIISVRKARYQKRLYLKMLLMFLIYLGLLFINYYPVYVLSQITLFVMVFYLFLFQHSFGITALMDDLEQSLEGESK
jgi:hypothetical protein